MTASAPRICCLDLDTFFVSVERLLDPSLEGKPVVVGGTPGHRGVVTAASYEVRRYGVHSGMPLAEAVRKAPHAIFVPTRHGVYGPYARRVRQVAERYTPVSRVASIDEMYLDFQGCERMYARPGDRDADGTIERTLREMLAAIRREIGLPASAGIATSRPMSKVACGLAKPAGVLLVAAGSEARTLAPLSVRKYPGIGPVAEAKLARLGITTLGQLACAPHTRIAQIFGSYADRIQRGAQGHGSAQLGRERPAFREHDPQGGTVGSISNERTFAEDVSDPRGIERMLSSLCQRVCWRARKRGVRARTVTLRLRYADFHTITRSRTITPTHSERTLYPIIVDIYRRARTRQLPIRLLGIGLSNLDQPSAQLGLFEGGDERLLGAVDAIRKRYGYEAMEMAHSISAPRTTRDPPSPTAGDAARGRRLTA